jgi:hypothetical protein
MAQAKFLAARPVKKSATDRAGTQPIRVVVVGDTCVSEEGWLQSSGATRDIMIVEARMVSMIWQN